MNLDDWTPFLQCTELQELICTCTSPLPLMNALSSMIGAGHNVLFPKLHSLTLRNVEWHLHAEKCEKPFDGEPFSKAIDDMISARSRLAPPLRELVIRKPHNVDLAEGKDGVWFERMTQTFPGTFKWEPMTSNDWDWGCSLCKKAKGRQVV